MSPISPPAAASPRLQLRLLICNPRSYSSRNINVKGRNVMRTREDPYLPAFYTYECKSHTEWLEVTQAISKMVSNQNCFFAYAHLADKELPPSAAARVELVPGGVFSYVLQIDAVETVSIKPQEGATPTPATISDLAPSLEQAGQMPVSTQTDEGEQSGAAGEAACLPESTLSTTEETNVPAPEGSGDTLVSPDTGEDTDTAASAVPDAAGEQRGPVKAGKSAPAPQKRKPGRPARK